ncbi:MAG TPA: 1-acyl-sn-glycerol-3-phosphate acyltransferase [Candidatus Krumholzibacteria bacterium]|nr:1-acyl-sn-glycerol-3-phosphate acyltransferase [Candidatus Krumholzibacteria bacterium]
MMLLSQLTGITALLLIGLFFLVSDILTRIAIAPLVYFRRGSRERILGAWARFVSRTLVQIIRHVGRAHVDIEPVIASRGGVLIVMNHQSVIDIPVAFTCVSPGYPRMVARARYGRGIPLVSHMLSFYGHILVQPGRMGRPELDALAETARASTLPILIYPEGHRTRDGEIGPWKRAGLDAFFSARELEVYVVVIDGLSRVARLPDFIRNLSRVRCRVEMVGPFRYDGRGRENHDAFVDELRRAMVAKLAEMRAPANASRSGTSLVSSGK